MAGGFHHIIIRGIERKRIFREDQDRNNFLDRLGKILLESKTSCYAWALLPNHVHLLLRTGQMSLATVMGRLLTGYAVGFNHRYGRHGQLFQNRYKSILCQEDLYLLELVRYIHLNPLRAKIVQDYKALDHYRYCGHSVLLGYQKNSWQDVNYVLGHFGGRQRLARRKYREYVGEGFSLERRPELVGGGLIRSLGGWKEASRSLGGAVRLKGDERILGDSDFVLEVLKASEEHMERRYRFKRAGYDLEKLAGRVAEIFGVQAEALWNPGKYPKVVMARSLFSYWAVRELGVSATELARRMKLTQPAVSISVRRGGKIAQEEGLAILGS